MKIQCPLSSKIHSHPTWTPLSHCVGLLQAQNPATAEEGEDFFSPLFHLLPQVLLSPGLTSVGRRRERDWRERNWHGAVRLGDSLSVSHIQMLIFILLGHLRVPHSGALHLQFLESNASSHRLPAVYSVQVSIWRQFTLQQVHFPQDEQSSCLLRGPGLAHGKPTHLSMEPQLSPKAAGHVSPLEVRLIMCQSVSPQIAQMHINPLMCPSNTTHVWLKVKDTMEKGYKTPTLPSQDLLMGDCNPPWILGIRLHSLHMGERLTLNWTPMKVCNTCTSFIVLGQACPAAHGLHVTQDGCERGPTQIRKLS